MPTDGKKQMYGFLEKLSTEQLEDLLRADFESSEDGDCELALRVLEVIEKRENEQPSGYSPDVDRAWENFQTYFNTPDGTDRSLYPVSDSDLESIDERLNPRHRRGKLLRRLLPLAAVVAVTFFGMIAAQALGVDVFGALAQWTEDTFHFVIGPPVNACSPESEEIRQVVQDAFDQCGITIPAPAWYPDGTMLARDIKVTENSDGLVVLCEFTCPDGSFYIEIQRYFESHRLPIQTFEKDASNIAEYSSRGRQFYIMSNQSNARAVYSNNRMVIVINGKTSTKTLKQIIDSIGE